MTELLLLANKLVLLVKLVVLSCCWKKSLSNCDLRGSSRNALKPLCSPTFASRYRPKWIPRCANSSVPKTKRAQQQ
jgi:hypothetical protein